MYIGKIIIVNFTIKIIHQLSLLLYDTNNNFAKKILVLLVERFRGLKRNAYLILNHNNNFYNLSGRDYLYA